MLNLLHIPSWSPHVKLHVVIHSLLIVWSQLAAAAEVISLQHEFGPNLVPIASVLQAPNTNGGEIAGVGNGDWEKHPLQRGLGSWVYPDAETTEPLITLTGTNWHLHDFSLHGCEPSMVAPAVIPRAGILVKFAAGVGTGGNTIERVNVSDVGAALRFGDIGDKSMCDTTTTSKLNVKRVDYVAYNTHSMAMQNNFQGIVASEVRRAMFYFEDGGCSDIADCSLTRVNPSGNQVAYLGLGFPQANCWTYTVRNAKIDKQCGNNACFLDMDKPISGTATFIGCHTSTSGYGAGKYLWNLHDAIRITIIGGTDLLQKNSIFVKRDWPNFNPPTIVAINVDRCASPEEMVAPGSAPVYIQCIGCGTQQTGLPVGRMMNFSFNNVVDRSKETIQ